MKKKLLINNTRIINKIHACFICARNFFLCILRFQFSCDTVNGFQSWLNICMYVVLYVFRGKRDWIDLTDVHCFFAYLSGSLSLWLLFQVLFFTFIFGATNFVRVIFVRPFIFFFLRSKLICRNWHLGWSA